MSQFANKSKVASKKAGRVRKTTNRAGGEAFTKTPEVELVGLLASFKMGDDYYRPKGESLARLKTLLGQVDPLFAAQAAVYARNELGMRSVSHVAAAEIAHSVAGAGPSPEWTKSFLKAVSRRADDPVEILAYYLGTYGKSKVTNAMRKGLGQALTKFDSYQIAKYRRDGQAFSMVDAVNLLHPPKTEALTALVNGTLKPAETWETKRTQAGQVAKTEKLTKEEKEAALASGWRDLLAEKKLPYMAMVRNLRNILREAPDTASDVAKFMTNPKAVANSKLFPYHFYLAVKALEAEAGLDNRATNIVLGALDDALALSCDNVPVFDGDTLVVCDFSGSMQSAVTLARDEKGKEFTSLTRKEVGILMGIMMGRKNDADFMVFGSTSQMVRLNPRDSITSTVKFLHNANEGWGRRDNSGIHVGHGTNFHSIFEGAQKGYDRIIIFSDEQGWMRGGQPGSSVNAFKKRTGANHCKIFSWNLAGLETSMFPEHQVAQLGGFSSKMFDTLQSLDVSPQALVKKIKEITFE